MGVVHRVVRVVSRIEAADPDAILALYFFGLLLIVGSVALVVAHYKTKRWPTGHGASYWSSARRINDE